MDKRPIGMFDSGVGGMTVFSKLIKELPNEDVIYFGDTKRFPYGNKSKESIISISKQAVEFLISKNVKYIIIACGTATSQALEELKRIYKIPIIGIINPTVEYIKEHENLKNIGVIATRGTIKSNAWEKKIKEKIKDINVINRECPVLADIAEQGWTDNKIAKLILEEYLIGMENIDALILGCTHYPLFKNKIQEILGKNIELIDTGEKLSIYLKKELEKLEITAVFNNIPKYEFYLSDTESNFTKVANKLLDGSYNIEENDIKKVEF